MLAGMVLLAAASSLRAQEVTTLFPARPAGHLTDVARVVPADAAQRIEALARDLRTRTGAELAIVTLPTIGDREPEEVALAILRTWGVGAKAEIGDQTRNAGLVVLVVPKPADGSGRGRLRIEVGNGLEGIVPDLQAARVRDAMRPQLAAGDYGGGLLTGVQALDQLITQGMDPRAPKPKAGSRERINIVPVIIVGFVLLMILSGAMGGAAARSSGVRYGGRTVSRRRGPFDGGPYIGGGWGGGSGWGGGGFGGGGGGFTFGGGGGGSGGGAGGDF
jgi:uncharacterized protein